MNREEVLTKLRKHIISRASYPHIPLSLDGEILLEEHRGEKGELLGVVSVSVDALLNLPDLNDNTNKRRRRDRVAFTYNEMITCDPEDQQGYRKYFNKWKDEMKDAEHS